LRHRRFCRQATIEQLEDSAFNIEQWPKDEYVVRFERGLNADLTNGTGSGQPNGIVTAASAGITTAGNSGLIYDDIVDFVHSVDPLYRRDKSCRFQFNDDI
jgi:HK97 family phage major capsid protein